MKKTIFLLAAIVLFACTGCAGGTGTNGVSAGGNPGIGEQNPAPANPFGTPVDGTTEVEATEGDEAPPAAAPRQPRTTTPDDDTPRIECFERALPEGRIGDSYTYALEATEGSGEFTYELTGSNRLPVGLALESDGTINGTPTAAAESSARVTVTDEESGKTRSCRVNITIKGELSLTKEILFGKEGEWDAVYKVTASEGFDDLTWTWDDDTKNVCASGAAPDTNKGNFRKDCTAGELNATGNVVYVWLKEDRQDGRRVSVALGASSPLATDDATLTLSFTYTPAPQCHNGVIEEGEACDDDAVTPGYSCNNDCTVATRNPVDAQSVKVTLWTGDVDNVSDTDCTVKIKFCKDKNMSDCTKEVSLDDTDDGDDRENGEENIYDATDGLAPNALGYLTDAHRYFQISLVDEGCGDDTNNWLLQGIKVEISYGELVPPYTYFNPSVLKWMDDGDKLPFGPNDTAVCAIITTASGEYTGTDDRVSLVLENFDSTQAEGGFVVTSLNSWSSHFTQWETGGTSLEMSWDGDPEPDDFESGDDASYGDYLFDVAPFTSAPKFFIQKEADGSGWRLSTAEVFVFRPGKFLNDPSDDEPTVYHNSSTVFDEWLDNETRPTRTTGRTLEAVEGGEAQNVITVNIGQHHPDLWVVD